MKSITLTLLLLFSLCPLAGQQPVDTLYANQRQVLSLFFESPIEKAVTGAPNYAFTFNREQAESLGLLQATEGPQSNLLVVTQDGGIYSFVVAFRDSLKSFTRFIPEMGRVHPEPKKSLPKADSTVKDPEALLKICQQMLRQKLPYAQIQKQRGIHLKMTDSFYHNAEVYVVFELENGSGIDYQIEELTLLKVLGNTARKSSYQQRPITPIWAYHRPEIVPQGTTERFVLVYPKFTLGQHESLKVILKEKMGSRNFSF
jgi:hypothetical protein